MVGVGIEIRPLRRFGLALQFLTRVPVRISGTVTEADLAASMSLHPLVGASLGLALAGIGMGIHVVLPPAVAVLWVLAASIFLTGNLHLDGIMDTADGVYGAYEPERRLEIMKDSRVGAHGVAAAILVLGMKGSLLLQLAPIDWWAALPVALAFGRCSLVFGACRFDYARPAGGLGQTYMEQVSGAHLLIATLGALLVGWAFAPSLAHVVAVTLGALVTAQLAGWYVARKIGGMTGDTLGALNEIVEIVVLTLWVVMAT